MVGKKAGRILLLINRGSNIGDVGIVSLEVESGDLVGSCDFPGEVTVLDIVCSRHRHIFSAISEQNPRSWKVSANAFDNAFPAI